MCDIQSKTKGKALNPKTDATHYHTHSEEKVAQLKGQSSAMIGLFVPWELL